MNEAALDTLKQLQASINKKWGKGAVTTLDSRSPYDRENAIDSGSLGLNLALGIGGYPRGRIIEIAGMESAGKTTLALEAIATEQELGHLCAFIDMEHALDVVYASKLGVDTHQLLLSQPSYGEQALDITEMLVRSNQISLIVVDSVAALVPQKELEGDAGESHVGLQARMMSQAMRKLAGPCNTSQTTIIFINQYRQKIGVIYGSNDVVSGGMALKFYASQRLDIRKVGSNKDGDEIVSNEVRVKVIKNKMAAPFKETRFNILFGNGIDRISEIFDLAIENEIIEKSGSWFKYNGENIGQGEATAKEWMTSTSEIQEKITSAVIKKALGETND
jgi:recombination protein RecA